MIGSIGPTGDGKISGGCGKCGWGTTAPDYPTFVKWIHAHACVHRPPPPPPLPYDALKDILDEVDEALAPSNARKFDGDNNYQKCVDIKTCIVGADDGSPVFVLDAKSPRSAVNNLGMSIHWSTNDRAEAATFLRKLADKIEEGQS